MGIHQHFQHRTTYVTRRVGDGSATHVEIHNMEMCGMKHEEFTTCTSGTYIYSLIMEGNTVHRDSVWCTFLSPYSKHKESRTKKKKSEECEMYVCGFNRSIWWWIDDIHMSWIDFYSLNECFHYRCTFAVHEGTLLNKSSLENINVCQHKSIFSNIHSYPVDIYINMFSCYE